MTKFLHLILFLLLHQVVTAQVTEPVKLPDTLAPLPTNQLPVLSDTTEYNDTTLVQTARGTDTVVKKKVHSPRKATLRSVMIPGWGQIYNKKYWKVPIVYGAIGFPVYLFFDNRKWYNRTRYALSIVVNNQQGNLDSMSRVHPDLLAFVERKAQASLVNYRNEFRKNMDYSILFTLLMYGLNIVDATVDGHLKGFDVGDELTFKLKPSLQQGSLSPGISLVVSFR